MNSPSRRNSLAKSTSASSRGTPRALAFVVGEPVEVLDHQLEALGRADVDQHVRLVVADVPPVVHDPRRDLDLPPCPGQLLAAIDVEANAAGQHFEALGDVGVHVLARDRAARPDVEVAHQALAPRVLTALAHHEAVSARCSSGWPRPRSVASDNAAISSARRM